MLYKTSINKLLDSLSAAPWEFSFPIDIPFGPGQSLRLLGIFSRKRGRFICASADRNGVPIIVMMFFGWRAKKFFRQHLAALESLRAVKFELPGMSTSDSAGCFTVTITLSPGMGSQLVAHGLFSLPGDLRKGTAVRVIRALGALHRAGVGSANLDIAGFLCPQGQLEYVPLQPLQILARSGKVPLTLATENLAQILAQLPPDFDRDIPELCSVYAASADLEQPLVNKVRQLCLRYRSRYVRLRLLETENASLQFSVFRSWKRDTVVSRSHLESIRPFLSDPENCMTAGEPLKLGTANTVVKVALGGRYYTIKRYNLKNWRFICTRLFKASRPLRAWRAAQAFSYLGVSTAEPVALLRERWGPFYFRAWMVTEHIDAPHFGEYFSNNGDMPALSEPQEEMLLGYFRRMVAGRLTHGDLKCTNLLWHKTLGPVSIDIDAARFHGCNEKTFRRMWRKDRRRFLRNWPAETPFHRWLDRHLPPEEAAAIAVQDCRSGAGL